MRCLIVDDTPIARVAVRRFAEKIDGLEVAGECENAAEAFRFLENDPVDLLLLDVEMPDSTGLELFSSLSPRPAVIFITSKRDYAADAFDQKAVDFLVKPVAFARFQEAIERARHVLQHEKTPQLAARPDQDFLFVRADGNLVKLRHDDILWVQALVDYVQFVMVGGKKWTVHATMKAVENHLPPAKFARTHRSHIVQIAKIDRIEEGTMAVVGKEVVPISEQYKASLLKKLNLL